MNVRRNHPLTLTLALLLAAALLAPAGAGAVNWSKPDFVAVMDAAQTVPFAPNDASGIALFKFNGKRTKLRYKVQVVDLDLDGFVTPDVPGDDVTRLHFHFGVPGLAGPHILNVYKFPREDDRDLYVKPFDGVIRGVWDDGDENLAGIPSYKLSDVIEYLCNGNAYVNAHTVDHETGAIRGQIQPASKVCKKLLRRWR
jgi:hypothetical protein